MKLIINKQKNNHFDTELNDVLNNIDRNYIKIFNYEHNLLSPIRQYEDVLKRVIEDFEDLLNFTNFKVDITNREHWKKVNKKHCTLIESLVAYIDVTYAIMKCFYPKKRGKDDILFNDKWLKHVDRVLIGNYTNNIYAYKKIFSKINNKVKHENRELTQISCSPLCYNNISIISNGFFVVGCDSEGAIGPDLTIHKEWKGKYVGISYNKNIRDIIVCLYSVSHYAAETIKKIIQKEYNTYLVINKYESKFNQRLKDIIIRVNSMNEIYFPNEYNTELKVMRLKDDILYLQYPCTKKYFKNLYKATKYKISFTNRIDEYLKMGLLYYDN